MNNYEMAGLMLTIVLMVGISIYSGKNSGNKKSKKGNNSWIVAGVIIGTLVGGASTVGTAQLAYTFGMSAWWFTLGGGISCLVLACCFIKPFRHKNISTLVGMINDEYGDVAGVSVSLLNTLGTFINIISQMIAASAVIAVVFPGFNLTEELIITGIFMILYVIFGGTRGAGMVGMLKASLLYIAMMSSGIMVLKFTSGLGGFKTLVETIPNPENVNFFSVIARGAGTDLGAAFSLLLGVLTTQTYAQSIIQAKSDNDARKGALLSAFLIPPIGVGGILVGLYMRATAPDIVSKTALTEFVTQYMPPVLSGIILGTLFIAVVGTGAGLALGISTIINDDIVGRISSRLSEPNKKNLMEKVWIVVIIVAAGLLSNGSLGDLILGFAFMSMGLRAASTFAPLCASILLPGKVNSKFAVASIIVGPVTVLVGNIIKLSIDPLFIGVGLSLVIVALGINRNGDSALPHQ